MLWFNSKIKKDSKMYKKMNLERFILRGKPKKHAEAEEMSRKIDGFVENTYARDIFDKFSKKKPKLICNQSDEVVDWNTAFGTNFDGLSKELRHSLVGLLEGGGKYRFR